MLLYNYNAPSPRRVRIFLAEKNLAVPIHTVDLAKKEQFSPEYSAKNPRCTVPMLELDDGSCIWDTLAICEYIEALYPQTPMFGSNALEHAQVVMWYQRIEFEAFASAADVFRNASRNFKDHSLTGAGITPQIPALIERGKECTYRFYQTMNEHLQSRPFVAGNFFSLADIQLLCMLDFASGWGRMPVPEDCTTLLAWQQQASARPSAKA
jgi:glutathione S-transferase